MGDTLNLKTRLNKRNGQINISLPRKELSRIISRKNSTQPLRLKSLRLKVEGWELE